VILKILLKTCFDSSCSWEICCGMLWLVQTWWRRIISRWRSRKVDIATTHRLRPSVHHNKTFVLVPACRPRAALSALMSCHLSLTTGQLCRHHHQCPTPLKYVEFTTRTVPTGQGRREKVSELEWSGKVRERTGKMENLCHQMSDFPAKMHQFWFPLVLRFRPRWGSSQRSPGS